MGWSLGFDSNWNRDIGYGVPAWCDAGCGEKIDRGLAFVCGGNPYGEPAGCGLYFCYEHLFMDPVDESGDRDQLCTHCFDRNGKTFEPTPEHPEWVNFKLTDESWAQWRDENPNQVALLNVIVQMPGGMV